MRDDDTAEKYGQPKNQPDARPPASEPAKPGKVMIVRDTRLDALDALRLSHNRSAIFRRLEQNELIRRLAVAVANAAPTVKPVEEMSEYRSPPEWSKLIDKSESHFRSKFKKSFKGENHPISGAQLVRFPVSELKRAGVPGY